MYQYNQERRLLKSEDFQYVFDNASKIKCKSFLVLHKPGLTQNCRLGLIVSKKKIAKAHDRNRIKRIIRESFRVQNLPPVDVVVLSHSGNGKLDNTMLFKQLGNVWIKLKNFYVC